MYGRPSRDDGPDPYGRHSRPTGSDEGAARTLGSRLAAHFRPGDTGPVLVVCCVLAYASLAVPAVLGYDPWAWLVWGREATRGQLSTEGGPTWKPLPVLLTTVLAYTGAAAPELWLVLSRAGGLFAIALTYRLAARYAGAGAGVVAALALLLTPDDEARFVRHLLQGNVEPLTVGLCLWAVPRHLDGRRGQAFLLGAATALLRPEAGPLLALYGGWLLWAHRRRWFLVVPGVGAVLAAVPLLWLGGDWFASGDPFTGAARAQVLEGAAVSRLVVAMEQVGGMVILPVWVAAAAGVVWAAHRRRPAPVVLAAGALGWAIVVAAMAGGLGYAALSRFLAPPAAILCVLAGIGVARAVTAVDDVGYRLSAAFVLLVAVAPFTAPRAEWLPVQVADAAERRGLAQDLDQAVATAGGREALLSCGQLAIKADRPIDLQARPALAWQLDRPLVDVLYVLSGPGVAIVRTGSATDSALSALPATDGRALARTPGWSVFAVGCATPADEPRLP